MASLGFVLRGNKSFARFGQLLAMRILETGK
jgi:hypothetical protein